MARDFDFTGGRRFNVGFTLIEVLLVVAILAVLAGTIIPGYLTTADDAKKSSLSHNLSALETQLEFYRTQHLGKYPTITNNSLPQLTSSTSSDGTIGLAGPNFPFGPYILEPPMNPYDGSKNVEPVAVQGQKPGGVVGNAGGWQFDVSNGAFWPNNPEYYK